MTRTLTPAEARLVRDIGYRMLSLQQRIEALMKLPLEDTHEETGLPVWFITTLAIEQMGWLNIELSEALS